MSKNNSIIQIIFLCAPFAIGGSTHFVSSFNKHGFFSIIPDEQQGNNPNWHIDKISLDEAWEISTSYDGYIGVADTGIYGSHRDLESNYSSYLSHDFFPNRNSPNIDEVCHGTGTSGLIGAKGDNSLDIAGVLWRTQLVSLRIDDDVQNQHLEDADCLINAIQYATDYSIPFVNFSGGLVTYSSDENGYISSTQISTLYTKISNYPGLIICAAGNASSEIGYGYNEIYPQIFDLDNIIVVGASNQNDSLCSFTNYSQYDVDVFAPGTSLYTTIPYSQYTPKVDIFSGTSASAPLVTGVAGLLKSINNSLTSAQIKSAVLNNVDTISAMNNKCVSGGRLNAYNAMLSVLPTFSTGQTLSSPQSIGTSEHQWYKINVTSAGVHSFSKQYDSMMLRCDIYSDIQGSVLASGTSIVGNIVSYNFPSTGTYYLKVINCSSTTGNYNISIN